jgi:hypothetical protein
MAPTIAIHTVMALTKMLAVVSIVSLPSCIPQGPVEARQTQ